MKIVLIIGHINTGKTTVANYLCEKYNFKRISLGDGVKEFTVKMFEILNSTGFTHENIKLEDLNNRDKKERYRTLMQQISTDCVKKVISENVWIDIVKQKIINSKHENIVIDDIRFKNELFELSNLNKNVLIIKLTRDCEIKSEHISEHDLDDTIIPNTINNNGTKEELFELVDSLIL